MGLKSDTELDSTQQLQQNQQKKHFHVLAVDDSLIDRKLLERLLTVSSYQVTCVDSGNKALEYLGLLDSTENDSTTTASKSSSTQPSQQEKQAEESKVNLIMTDYSMPGMNGYDLLKRVKGSSWKDVPVVVMSSENVPSRINMCLEGGAEQFLLKPVRLSDLMQLQSNLMKPLSYSCKNMDNNFSETENNNNNANANANKRKAMSPEAPSKRRSKMKELAVI